MKSTDVGADCPRCFNSPVLVTGEMETPGASITVDVICPKGHITRLRLFVHCIEVVDTNYDKAQRH